MHLKSAFGDRRGMEFVLTMQTKTFNFMLAISRFFPEAHSIGSSGGVMRRLEQDHDHDNDHATARNFWPNATIDR